LVERVGEVVVAGPVFEQVAEQVQGLRARRVFAQEAVEGFGVARVRGLKVKV